MKILVFILSLSLILFASTSLDTCKILNSPGTYLISKDIDASMYPNYLSVTDGNGLIYVTCMYVNSSDIILDCQDHTIIGDEGIDVLVTDPKGLSNIVIQNCNIPGGPAIIIQNITNSKLENITSNDSGGAILVTSSINTHINNIHLTKTNLALQIKNSKSTFISNTTISNCNNGFVLDSSDLVLENSETTHNSEVGTSISSTSGRLSNIVIKNTKSNFNKEGFRIMSADNVIFENNEAKNNSNEGVIFETSNNVQISNLAATGNSAGLRITGPSEDVKLSKINASNNKYLGLSTFLIKKLEMESIFACSNKLNDTSIRESDYSKSNIVCDKSNPVTLCDVKCSSTKGGSNSKNDKNCIGALLLASILFLVFKRG